MKITTIEPYHVSVPLRETFWTTWISGYPQTHNRFTAFVTSSGVFGLSMYLAGALAIFLCKLLLHVNDPS